MPMPEYDSCSSYSATPERVLFVGDASFMSGATMDALIDQFLLVATQDEETPIILAITSGGGAAHLLIKFLDIINAVDTPVITQVLGSAESAAALLGALAGVKGKRWISPQSSVMFHLPATMAGGGNIIDVNIEAGQLKRLTDWCLLQLKEVTGRSMRNLKQIMNRDAWFTAQEAVDFGFADFIGVCPELIDAYRSMHNEDEEADGNALFTIMGGAGVAVKSQPSRGQRKGKGCGCS